MYEISESISIPNDVLGRKRVSGRDARTILQPKTPREDNRVRVHKSSDRLPRETKCSLSELLTANCREQILIGLAIIVIESEAMLYIIYSKTDTSGMRPSPLPFDFGVP